MCLLLSLGQMLLTIMKYLHGLFLFHLSLIAASHDVDVAPIQWNGVAAYLAVDDVDVQEKLAAYQGMKKYRMYI